MHECPKCSVVCDCDGEDTWYDRPPRSCQCACECDEDDPCPVCGTGVMIAAGAEPCHVLSCSVCGHEDNLDEGPDELDDEAPGLSRPARYLVGHGPSPRADTLPA